MAVTPRQVKNKRNADGTLSGRAGKVYDVNVKYNTKDGVKAYVKKGFLTKQDAVIHEGEIRSKLASTSFLPATQTKITVKEHLESWVESHGKTNLRPSTYDRYLGLIKTHLVPNLGHVRLRQLSPALIDAMCEKLYDKGLAQNTVRNAVRVLSVALEASRRYGLIDKNPAQDIITKFGKQAKTPDPYTVNQLQKLMECVAGTDWEFIVVLGGMYGLRISEILGLRCSNINLDEKYIKVVEQLPFNLAIDTTKVNEMAPVKSKARLLPITDVTLPYFQRRLELLAQRKNAAGEGYFDNDIIVSKPNGAPLRRENVSKEFGRLIHRFGLPIIRFHDLRHSAATNMHQLTGDFYTVGEILGHTLKGIGITLGISMNLEATTAQYVEVRMERKKEVLTAYHAALHIKS